jgi:diaminopimelate decarboxylase
MEQINNFDIKELANQFGTPLYVYDSDIIKNNYSHLIDSFRNYYPNTDVHYSVKANTNIHILKHFKEIGCKVDCSSPIEAALVRKAGFTDEEIIYTGNYEDVQDFQSVYSDNVTINLDDISSFLRLRKVTLPKKVSFRINPGIGKGGFEGNLFRKSNLS